jgi:hypothetical protein
MPQTDSTYRHEYKRARLLQIVKDYTRLALAEGLKSGEKLPAHQRTAHESIIRHAVADNAQMLYNAIDSADLDL